MSKTRPFSELAAKIPDTPERRSRAVQFRRAMDTSTALGGELEINAVFPDQTVTLVPTETPE